MVSVRAYLQNLLARILSKVAFDQEHHLLVLSNACIMLNVTCMATIIAEVVDGVVFAHAYILQIW